MPFQYKKYIPFAAFACTLVLLYQLNQDDPEPGAALVAIDVHHFLGPTEIVSESKIAWKVSGPNVQRLVDEMFLAETIDVNYFKELAKRLNGNSFIDFEGNIHQKGTQVPLALMQGSWSQDYVSATNPLHWPTNIDTLCERYLRNKQTLKYGQCWIFAAFVVAICRAKNIPARALVAQNVSVDADNDGDFENYKGNADFAWTFHVWTEVYFDNQWHAFDACPRQVWYDTDIFCAGPVPLDEVRNAQPATHTDEIAVIPYTKDTVDARYFATCALSPQFQAFIHDQGEKINVTSNYKKL